MCEDAPASVHAHGQVAHSCTAAAGARLYMLPPVRVSACPAALRCRALYALEAAWHPAFNVASGDCRLDFEVAENRALFTCLHRRMQVG